MSGHPLLAGLHGPVIAHVAYRCDTVVGVGYTPTEAYEDAAGRGIRAVDRIERHLPGSGAAAAARRSLVRPWWRSDRDILRREVETLEAFLADDDTDPDDVADLTAARAALAEEEYIAAHPSLLPAAQAGGAP